MIACDAPPRPVTGPHGASGSAAELFWLSLQVAPADQVGGSTYHLALWRGHPLEEQVTGELRRFRERMSSLRDQIDRYNAAHPEEGPRLRVDCYYGQSVSEEKEDDESE